MHNLSTLIVDFDTYCLILGTTPLRFSELKKKKMELKEWKWQYDSEIFVFFTNVSCSSLQHLQMAMLLKWMYDFLRQTNVSSVLCRFIIWFGQEAQKLLEKSYFSFYERPVLCVFSCWFIIIMIISYYTVLWQLLFHQYYNFTILTVHHDFGC